MSCNYAEGLSPYEHKGVLGAPERFDNSDTVDSKCEKLADWILNSKHVVLHTGAGISTTAGIPDFRGPNGVWTLEKQGKKPNIDISFGDATPTKTHMSIKKLIDHGYVNYVISQNIDGLHMRTGIRRKFMAELHGNMFIEECNFCDSQFIRRSPAPTVGKKCLEIDCRRFIRGRPCRGKLCDTILDWEHSLPDKDLEMSDYHASLADLNICLGTTLQIVPSGNLPVRCKKYGGKVVIINLQPTKHDKKADLIINTYVDDVMIKVMKRMGLEIPEYSQATDPTKNQVEGIPVEWNILKNEIKEIKAQYDEKCKNFKKRKLEMKSNIMDLKVLKREKTEVDKNDLNTEKIEGELSIINTPMDIIDLT